MRDYNKDGVLVGRPDQDIYEASTTQNYPIGMVHRRHGREFAYCQAVEAIVGCGRGLPNMSIVPGDTNGDTTGMETSLQTAAAVGDNWLDCLNPGTTAFPVDYFVGGLAVIFSTGSIPGIWCSRISGNKLFDSTSGIVYLDEDVPVIVAAATMGVSIYCSPYKNVGTSGSCSTTLRSVVAINHIDVAINSYFWGQTKGPCWVTPTAFGSARRKCFHSDGTIIDFVDGMLNQMAGYAMNADYDGGYGDGVIMLDI